MKHKQALVVFAILLGVAFAANPCKPVTMSKGVVCECTADYCDSHDPVGDLATDDVAVYQTSKAGDRLTRSTLKWSSTGSNQSYHISIDKTLKYQKIIGFGGALTDAVALDIAAMTPEVQEVVLQQYYGPNGIGYSIGRVPIASSDFSTSDYTYAPVENDFSLVNFNIDMDLQYKIPLIQRVLKMTPLKLFSSVWGAPAWLKDNNSTHNNGKLKGVAGDEYHQTWALYFSKFFTAYKEHGIPFWATTVQNEPAGNTGAWQDIVYTAEEEAAFVRLDLGPRLKADHPEIQIMVCDDQRSQLPGWASTYASDPEAGQYVSGIAFHWYEALEDTIDDFYHLSDTHALYPQFFMLASEACTGYLPWSQGPYPGDWTRGQAYGHDVLQDLLHYANGWTDWNIALDMSGGPNWAKNVVDSPILLDTTNRTVFYKEPMFYFLAHFSAFIPPDSIRIEALSEGLIPLETVSFLTPDNHVVVVVLNRDDVFSRSFTLFDPNHGYLELQINPGTIQTYVYKV